jgi:predicted O-linked N-acetylglucosamine transferase (SPINDLY family)
MSFGHPETSGIPNMDWFVSGDLYEPEGGEHHYSERLHLLHDVGTLAYYYRPELSVEPSRARFDLPAQGSANLYLCPQTLFKLHPAFDAILAGILEADVDGMLLLLEAKRSTWSDLLRARLERTLGPALMSRVRFLPQQGTPEFLALIASVDVMLDTIHFNGMNTSLEAFAVGTPVVTWPGAFQRGRHTAGMYRRMGIEALVAGSAQAYVELAARLGRDTAFRGRMRAEILARSHVLYADATVVRQFEAFFAAALEACPAVRAQR